MQLTSGLVHPSALGTDLVLLLGGYLLVSELMTGLLVSSIFSIPRSATYRAPTILFRRSLAKDSCHTKRLVTNMVTIPSIEL